VISSSSSSGSKLVTGERYVELFLLSNPEFSIEVSNIVLVSLSSAEGNEREGERRNEGEEGEV
jgi:hypothetical protein